MAGPDIICVGAGKSPQDVLNVSISFDFSDDPKSHLRTRGIRNNAIKIIISFQRVKREATYSYQTLTVPEDSAANVLCVNGTLFHRSEKEIPESFKVSFWLHLSFKFTIE